MKLDVDIEYTGYNKYEKIFLRFHSAKNKSEAKLLKALSFEEPVYIAGAEPRISVYVGGKKKEAIKEVVKVERSPTKNMGEFWRNLIKANPALYPFPCICGMAQKTIGAHTAHQKKCAVLALKEPLFKYIYNTVTYQESEDGIKRRKKKSKRKDDVQAVARMYRQRRKAKQNRKKVSQRAADPD